MIPTILYFARGFQADFFPSLPRDGVNPLFVTLTEAEAERVRRGGGDVAACFEQDFLSLKPVPIPEGYLITSYVSDRFLGRFDAAKRAEILGKEIAFWSDLLDRHQPAAVVNELVAIEISEVLLIECRSRGIPYLAALNCPVDGLFYWLPDPITTSGMRLPPIEPSSRSLELAQSYMREVYKADYAPYYVKGLSGRLALKPLLIGLIKAVYWKMRALTSNRFEYEVYEEEYIKRLEVFFRSLAPRYDRLEDIPSEMEVIFYPMHQEPEATLNYMSEFLSNQPASIENMLKCLKPGQLLVVKEHPADKGSLLRKRYREVRRRNSAVRFLPAEISGRQVLARAARVVTLTSTVGWEAAVMGKAVYVLGEVFYDHLPGVQAIAHWADLRQALLRGAESVRGISREEAEHFVAQLVEISRPGYAFMHPELYSETNRRNMVRAILDGARAGEKPASVERLAAG